MVHFKIRKKTLLPKVLEAYARKQNRPMKDFRFIDGGTGFRLSGNEASEYLDLQDGHDILANLAQEGMFSTFTASNISDPLVKYLMLSDRDVGSEANGTAQRQGKRGTCRRRIWTIIGHSGLFERALPAVTPQHRTCYSPTPNLRLLQNLFSTIGSENSWDVFLISCVARRRNRAT